MLNSTISTSFRRTKLLTSSSRASVLVLFQSRSNSFLSEQTALNSTSSQQNASSSNSKFTNKLQSDISLLKAASLGLSPSYCSGTSLKRKSHKSMLKNAEMAIRYAGPKLAWDTGDEILKRIVRRESGAAGGYKHPALGSFNNHLWTRRRFPNQFTLYLLYLCEYNLIVLMSLMHSDCIYHSTTT